MTGSPHCTKIAFSQDRLRIAAVLITVALSASSGPQLLAGAEPSSAAVVPPPPGPAARPTAPAAPEWKVLFDGERINGLRGLQKPDFLKAGWKIEEGALFLPKEIKESGRQTGGDLVTAESFDDFEFAFEWRMSVAGNSGVLYFARKGAGGKPAGHEYQLIDDMRHPDGLKGGPVKRTGALYGILPPGESKLLADAGQWNEGRIVVHGNRVEHWLNGEKILTYQPGSPTLLQALRGTRLRWPPHVGWKSRSSIVLLDEGEEIAFRNLKVRALGPATGR